MPKQFNDEELSTIFDAVNYYETVVNDLFDDGNADSHNLKKSQEHYQNVFKNIRKKIMGSN